jgi:hypothetical protein
VTWVSRPSILMAPPWPDGGAVLATVLELELETPLWVRVADAALLESVETHPFGLWPRGEIEPRLRLTDSFQLALAANATLATYAAELVLRWR